MAVEHLLAAEPSHPDALVEAVRSANRAIVAEMSPAAGSIGMGTTVAVVLIRGEGLVVVNVGDSAVLELVDDQLVQLSTDDVLRPSDLLGLPSSVVTQSLGGASNVVEIVPNVYEDDLVPPRRLLLCTDGLTNFVSRREIAAAMGKHDARAAVERLLQLALEAGGSDNVTCALVDVGGFSR